MLAKQEHSPLIEKPNPIQTPFAFEIFWAKKSGKRALAGPEVYVNLIATPTALE